MAGFEVIAEGIRITRSLPMKNKVSGLPARRVHDLGERSAAELLHQGQYRRGLAVISESPTWYCRRLTVVSGDGNRAGG
jgi:hypothetical protein